MNTVFFKNLGIIDFKEAWGLQESILNAIIEEFPVNIICLEQLEGIEKLIAGTQLTLLLKTTHFNLVY